MHIRMYWDAFGNYLQFELLNGSELTKINHKEFSDNDYLTLHRILSNPYSEMKDLQYRDLTGKQAENNYHAADGFTGATSNDLTFEYINGAVKTTYTLWKYANEYCRKEIEQSTDHATSFLRERYRQYTDNELWNLYLQADSLNSEQIAFEIGTRAPEGFKQHASKLKELTYAIDGIEAIVFFEKLTQLKEDNKDFTKTTLTNLPTYNQFKYLLAYNYILSTKYRKQVKKIEMQF